MEMREGQDLPHRKTGDDSAHAKTWTGKNGRLAIQSEGGGAT